MRKTVLAAAASFTIASGAGVMQASAADYFEPAPAPAPAPILHDWSGFYIGGHVGYGEADFEAEVVRQRRREDGTWVVHEGPPVQRWQGDLGASGILGGLQGGFNWQAGAFVLGVEGDISFVDWSDNFAQTVRIPHGPNDTPTDAVGQASADVDFIASVRGRLGLALDTLLIYGTGGIAFTDAEANASVRVGDNVLARHSAEFGDVGWVVGGGAEWAAIPNRFSVGVEGLWYFFDDSETVTVLDPRIEEGNRRFVATGAFDDAWVVRARANFHF